MHVHRSFNIKEKRYAVPGELVYVDIAGMTSLAVVLQSTQPNTYNFLVLWSQHELKQPFWYHDSEADGFLTTYGELWILDIGNAAGVDIGEFGRSADIGSILYSGSQTYMRAGGPDQRHNLQNKNVNLATFGYGMPALTADTICIRSWKIWLSFDHMNEPGATPFFSFAVR